MGHSTRFSCDEVPLAAAGEATTTPRDVDGLTRAVTIGKALAIAGAIGEALATVEAMPARSSSRALVTATVAAITAVTTPMTWSVPTPWTKTSTAIVVHHDHNTLSTVRPLVATTG
jgi:hypothetical protein